MPAPVPENEGILSFQMETLLDLTQVKSWELELNTNKKLGLVHCQVSKSEILPWFRDISRVKVACF